MENQNLNDPSKDNLLNDADHPIAEDINTNRRLDNEHIFKEETAAEMLEDPPTPIGENRDERRDFDRDNEDRHEEVQNMYGWIAIALSAISFFIIPILFAGAGIIVGFIARNREAPILGNTAIVIGVLSILVRLFILPLI
ncbi:hypothetical protein SPD48_14090 [Pseudogracilibacillus sp. SE30717A]|uniref:hypothetical protein n=1 Tax=Pseudogracilibacillus sp. SE30717A TaxID=3098293 RepID=UPI00300DDA03